MKKLFIFLFFCCFAFESFAQHAFTNDDLEAFAKIYLLQKTNKVNFEVAYQAAAKENNIDQEAWAALRNKQIENIPLTANEINFLNAIQELKLKANRYAENTIQTYCVEENITVEKYNSILNKYKSDIEFQQNLKPFFDVLIAKK